MRRGDQQCIADPTPTFHTFTHISPYVQLTQHANTSTDAFGKQHAISEVAVTDNAVGPNPDLATGTCSTDVPPPPPLTAVYAPLPGSDSLAPSDSSSSGVGVGGNSLAVNHTHTNYAHTTVNGGGSSLSAATHNNAYANGHVAAYENVNNTAAYTATDVGNSLAVNYAHTMNGDTTALSANGTVNGDLHAPVSVTGQPLWEQCGS